MDSIMELAEENDIIVIKDAAHAFGGSYKGKMSGTIGHFGSFSFHEVKNITVLGERGIVVTNEPYGEDFPKARFVGFDGAHPIEGWLYDVVALKGKGATQISHYAPLYKFSYMKQLGYDTKAMEKSCPNAEELFQHRFTHLSLYPLSQEQLKYMADVVIEAVEERQR